MDIAAAADPFADARACMVDSQIRPNRVTDPRVLSAMRRLPRERFLPPRLAALAYADEDVPLGHGRVLIEPLVIARLVQLAAPAEGERVLIVAAGVGYGAALVAACGASVTAREEDQGLLALARSALDEISPSVTLVSGPLATGWPAGAPYDVVLIEGAVAEIPHAFDGQVRRNGGRLVTVIAAPGQASRAVLAEPSGPRLRAQPMFDCATPLLPSLRKAPGFQF